MHPLEQLFEWGQAILWIETVKAEEFLGPILDTDFGTPCPASRVTESLRLCQLGLTLP